MKWPIFLVSCLLASSCSVLFSEGPSESSRVDASLTIPDGGIEVCMDILDDEFDGVDLGNEWTRTNVGVAVAGGILTLRSEPGAESDDADITGQSVEMHPGLELTVYFAGIVWDQGTDDAHVTIFLEDETEVADAFELSIDDNGVSTKTTLSKDDGVVGCVGCRIDPLASFAIRIRLTDASVSYQYQLNDADSWTEYMAGASYRVISPSPVLLLRPRISTFTESDVNSVSAKISRVTMRQCTAP